MFKTPNKPLVQLGLVSLFGLAVAGCSSVAELDSGLVKPELPQQWSTNKVGDEINDKWLDSLINQAGNQSFLTKLIEQALNNNQQLKAQAYGVEVEKQRLVQAGSALWPSLTANGSFNRRKITNDNGEIFSESHSQGLTIQYEVDVWGKLSANEQRANLALMAQQMGYESSKQQLVVDVLANWFDLAAAKQLLQLTEQRVEVSKQNLTIIESGYQQGLNAALDVYLTRNELNSELSTLANQQQTVAQLERQLNVLVGQYPNSNESTATELPLLTDEMPLGMPSELVKRQPQLQAQWYQLLAKDAALAFAHKQRFPSLNLRAEMSKGGSKLQQLFEGGLGWSLLASVSAPIFDAGRLAAGEKMAEFELRQAEQQYLDRLYQSLLTVENGIANEQALKQRYQLMVTAEQNATAAMDLSFEQYRSGLVSYTTVLDAQRRAFQAKATVVQIKQQLLTNRLNLHLSLGGDFTESEVIGLENVKQN